MISEATIDSVVLAMQEEGYEDTFAVEVSDYWNYLNSESFQGLSRVEQELMYFLNSVIFNASKAESKEIDFDIEAFQEREEDNWAFRESAKDWASAKDGYFEDYEEEDLLAFVEDMLVSEEAEQLTVLGREVLFITCKSFVDLIE